MDHGWMDGWLRGWSFPKVGVIKIKLDFRLKSKNVSPTPDGKANSSMSLLFEEEEI
jgi:hypothetical protein